MADIFLSYKSEDRALVHNLARALEREGYCVWWDRKIAAGGSWRETILCELRGAKVVVAAWSRRTEDVNAAAWMLNEIDEAARLGLPVIPVMLERCEAPFGYRHVQAANLSNWRGEVHHPEWREVLAGVRAALGGARLGRVTPAPAREPPRSRRTQGSFASVVLAAALLAAGAFGWRTLQETPHTAPASAASAPELVATPVVDDVAPMPAVEAAPPQIDSQRRRWSEAERASRQEVVAFAGRDGVRGVFRRTRGDLWMERNSEAGRAGFYRVDHADARHIELYDSERNLWARIDFEAGLISIKSAGEADFQPRYRIVEGDR